MPGHPTPDNSLQQLYTLMQRGDLPAAEALVRQLLQSAPNEARWWSWLGLLSALQDRLPDAEAAYGKAVALNPNAPADWDNLGVAHRRQGRPAEAENCARRAIALDESNADHWINLAGALFDQERWQEAGDKFREGLARNPQDAIAWDELAVAELHLGRFAAAQEAYERSLAIAPDNLDTAGRYAALLIQRGQAERALTLLQPLVAKSPSVAQLWLMLGNAHWLRTDLPQAEAAYRQAIALDPKYRVARHNLALVLLNQSPSAETESHVRRLLADDPNDPDEWTLLGAILQSTARIDESIVAFRRSVELKPSAFNHSRLLLGLQYAEGVTPEQLLTEHQAWANVHAPQFHAALAPPGTPSQENKPLRIGFVSSDFGLHPTGFLVLGALEHLPRDECSVVCYSDRLVADEYTARFQAAATIWRSAAGLSDQEFADLISKDEIDILVDLMGHGGNRLLVFARKPAPVQITWFGYVGTTGLPAMDFLLADRFHVREGEERWYTESILRLPNGYACYKPPPDAPPVAPLPALANGHVTFGCFNNPAKYSPRLLDAWSEILQKASSARLLLKYNGLDQPALQRWVQSQFSQRGVDPTRILMEGRSPHLELLAAYNRIDLALDTQPYSGGLTTCEALWMGVPVATCPGKTFAGRHSISHLTNAGYPEFIAQDLPGYIDLAVSWAGRLEELAALRVTMREQIRKSPLGDAPRFAQDFLALLQQVWQSRVTD